MDGIEGIVFGLAGIADLIILIVQFIVFLFELLFWGVLAIVGKKGVRPKFNFSVKERLLQKALYFLAIIIIGGCFFLHQYLFTARISFSSDSFFVQAWGVEYELRSESGRKSAEKGSEEYLTYRWDYIVITDDRFEPETYTLTKEDQRVALKSIGSEKAKEDIVNGLKDNLVNGLKDHLLNKAKEKLDSTLESKKE